MDIRKCAVIGCGFVGASIAFSLVESGLFTELVLIDINRKKAEGEAMDLNHGVPFAQPMKIWAGDYKDTAPGQTSSRMRPGLIWYTKMSG